MGIKISDDLFSYAVEMRRKLHEYPEVGFDLERTATLISNELDKMGIKNTNKYGKCRGFEVHLVGGMFSGRLCT